RGAVLRLRARGDSARSGARTARAHPRADRVALSPWPGSIGSDLELKLQPELTHIGTRGPRQFRVEIRLYLECVLFDVEVEPEAEQRLRVLVPDLSLRDADRRLDGLGDEIARGRGPQ